MRPASDLGWGSSSKTPPGSLSTGSPAGRYSSARRRLNVQSGQRKGGKCAAALARVLPSVIVDTEKVLREADGPTEARGPEASNTWWVERCSPRGAPQNRTVRAGRSPKNTSVNLHSIINNGLIPGGQDSSRRQTEFFLPIDPRDKRS